MNWSLLVLPAVPFLFFGGTGLAYMFVADLGDRRAMKPRTLLPEEVWAGITVGTLTALMLGVSGLCVWVVKWGLT